MLNSNNKSLKKVGAIGLKIFFNLFFIVISLFALVPLAWTVFASLKSGPEFSLNQLGFPESLHFENYVNAFIVANMKVTVLNTVVMTLCSVFMVYVMTFLFAYFINRFDFPGRKLMSACVLLGLMIPVHSFLVPEHIFFTKLSMINNLFYLSCVNAAFAMPFCFVLVENFLDTIPVEIEEAAIIDGATTFQRLRLVVLPMAKPIMATITIIESLWIWNEFPLALTLLNDASKRTLPLAMSNFRGEFSMDYTSLFAALVMVSLPIIVVYSICHNKIMEGMTAGAVKG